MRGIFYHGLHLTKFGYFNIVRFCSCWFKIHINNVVLHWKLSAECLGVLLDEYLS